MRRSEGTIHEQIFESVLKFLRPQTADKKYKTIVEEAVRLTGAKDGSIFLGDHGILNRVHSTTPHQHQLIPKKNGQVYQAYKNSQLKVIREEELRKGHPEKKKRLKCAIVVPLTVDNKSIGVLTLQCTNEARLSEIEMRGMSMFGEFAAHAVTRTQLLQEMRKALRSRNLFFSYVAHELKTPLTSILIYTHMMEKRVLAKKLIDKKWIHVVKEESKRVQQMIDEFLTVEKYQAQKMKFKKSAVSLSSVMDRCLADFWLTSPNHRVLLKNILKNNDKVIGDFDKLCQVVINLLNNAAKFSKSGSAIHVRLYRRTPYNVISVTDEGKGIPQSEMPYIFKAFYKGKSSTGKGIGLHLVKEIVEKHKGKISVHTKKNMGTTFEIKIPQYRPPQKGRGYAAPIQRIYK